MENNQNNTWIDTSKALPDPYKEVWASDSSGDTLLSYMYPNKTWKYNMNIVAWLKTDLNPRIYRHIGKENEE